MFSSLWKLAYAGTTKTLAAWGIEGAQLHRHNLDTEQLTFVIPTEDIFDNPIFPYDAALTLYRGDVVWFNGRVTTTPAFATSQERQSYIVSNAWARLGRVIYQQPYVMKTVDFSAYIGSWSSRVVLGQDEWGRKLTASEQITKISAYANMVGASLFTLSALGPFAIPPLETVRDITCIEAIRRMLSWTPDAVGAFSYGAGTTTLSILQRAALTPVSIDLADQDLVEEISGLTPRNDLVPRGVVIVYQTSVSDTTEGASTAPVTRETRDTAGLPTGVGVIFATVALGVQASGAPETVPVGLAAQYYAALSTVQWQGSIRLRELECSGLLRPGKKLNLLNGRTAWATMAATVQSTVEDLDTGRTEVELGVGPLLGLGDFVGAMQRFRDRNEAGAFPATQHNGTEGVTEQAADTDPAPAPEAPEDPPSPAGPPGPAPDVAPEELAPNPTAGADANPSTMVVNSISQDFPTDVAKIAKILYALNNASGALTCNSPGPGGTITLTLPTLPAS